MEIPLHTTEDRPPCGGCLKPSKDDKHVVVPLDWPPMLKDDAPYTPPPEDYHKVIEASLGMPIEKLGVLAAHEVERIYHDGLCGGARGNTKKAIPFRNWVAYVIKCLWTAYNKGILRGCHPPKTVLVGG